MKYSQNDGSVDPGDSPQGPRLSHFQRVKAKIKGLFKKYGWKVAVMICIGYLIRDTLLYIVLPYLVARKVVGD